MSAFSFGSLLDQATNEAIDQPAEVVGVTIADTQVGIECPYIGGITWSNLVAAHPPRPGAAGDLVVGYNETGLVLDYLKRHGALIQPGGEKVRPSAAEWNKFLDVTGAPVINSIALTLYIQNVQMPMDRANAAGKD